MFTGTPGIFHGMRDTVYQSLGGWMMSPPSREVLSFFWWATRVRAVTLSNQGKFWNWISSWFLPANLFVRHSSFEVSTEILGCLPGSFLFGWPWTLIFVSLVLWGQKPCLSFYPHDSSFLLNFCKLLPHILGCSKYLEAKYWVHHSETVFSLEFWTLKF